MMRLLFTFSAAMDFMKRSTSGSGKIPASFSLLTNSLNKSNNITVEKKLFRFLNLIPNLSKVDYKIKTSKSDG